MNTAPDGKDITIRSAVYGDYGVASLLMQQVHMLHVRLRPDIYAPLSVVLSEEDFRAAVDANGCLAAVCGGSVAGIALFMRREETRVTHVWRRWFFVDTIVVDEGARRRGVGTALISRLRELARSEGMDSVELQVNSLNASALKLYGEAGFRSKSINMEYPLAKT